MAGDFEQITQADRDAMQIGAETARQPKRVGGLDGKGWVELLERVPGASMPGGAGALVVGYLKSELLAIMNEKNDDIIRLATTPTQSQVIARAAAPHLRSALHAATVTHDWRAVANGIEAAINLLGC